MLQDVDLDWVSKQVTLCLPVSKTDPAGRKRLQTHLEMLEQSHSLLNLPFLHGSPPGSRTSGSFEHLCR